MQVRQELDPESLTLSPQPAAPHQGHFFKRTFQGGVGWNLSEGQQFNVAPERKAPSPALPRGPGTMQDKQTSQAPSSRSLLLLCPVENGHTVPVGSAGSHPIGQGGGGDESPGQAEFQNLGESLAPCSSGPCEAGKGWSGEFLKLIRC